jgi:hypothetical protein
MVIGLRLGAQHQSGQQFGHFQQAHGNSQPLGHVEREDIALCTVEPVVGDTLLGGAMMRIAEQPERHGEAPELAHPALQALSEWRISLIHGLTNLSHLMANVLILSTPFGFGTKKARQLRRARSILKGGGGDGFILMNLSEMASRRKAQIDVGRGLRTEFVCDMFKPNEEHFPEMLVSVIFTLSSTIENPHEAGFSQLLAELKSLFACFTARCSKTEHSKSKQCQGCRFWRRSGAAATAFSTKRVVVTQATDVA